MPRHRLAVLLAVATAACGTPDSGPSSAQSVQALADAAPADKLVAATRLEAGSDADLEALAGALEDPDWVVRAQATAILGRVGDAGLDLLITAADDEHESVRVGAIASLHMISGIGTVPYLVEALADESRRVRVRALRALAEAGTLNEAQARRVVNLIAAPSQRMRRWASLVAVSAGGAAVNPLLAALDDEGPHRWRVAWSLGQIGPDASAALPRLRELSDDPDAELSREAAAAARLIEAEE